MRRHAKALPIVVALISFFSVGATRAFAVEPEATTLPASDVSSTIAQLRAEVNPEGLRTSFRFEYGPTTAYGSLAPAGAAGDAGEGASATAVSRWIGGLQPATTYHYRVVATNASGTAQGADRTFTTGPGPTPPSANGRGYELVSPQNKGNGDVYDTIWGAKAAAAGGAAIFTSLSAFGEGVQANVGFMAYRGVRGANGGWASREVMAPVFRRPEGGIVVAVAWSEDLRYTLLRSDEPLAPGGVREREQLYIRDNDTGALRLITPGGTPPIAGEGGLYFTAATPDFSHILFETCTSLVPGAPELIGGCINKPGNLYDWVDDGSPNGELRLASVMPNGEPAPEGGYGGVGGRNNPNIELHAISDDGSRIFWWDPVTRDLYMRVDGEETVDVSASQRTVPDPAGAVLDIFMRATPDGSKVLFTSGEKLTDDSTAEREGFEGTTEYNQGLSMGGDLYSYDVETGKLTDLSVATEGGTAAMVGVLGMSNDGGTVYFAAHGTLAPGSDELSDPPGDRYVRVYRWKQGEVKYAFTLENFAENGGLVRLNYKTDYGPGEQPEARVSPDGRYLTFWSQRPLTGYETAGHDQYFRYDAQTESIACVSCNPRRSAASSDANILAPGNGSFASPVAAFSPRMLTPDGRVFFTTSEGLVSQDTNGQPDAYEWDGSPRLLSDGESPYGSFFADASASGDDAFFWTRARLSSFDTDDNMDIYDARVGGGDPILPPRPAACEGDACQSPPTPPIDATPASASFHGPGDAKPRFKKPRKRHKARHAAKRRSKHAGKAGRHHGRSRHSNG